MKKIVLAGGCFWGLEDLIRKQPGVINTTYHQDYLQKNPADYTCHAVYFDSYLK